MSKCLSFLTYNIEGLSTLYQQEQRAYISKFDIIVLTETFSTTFPSHLFPMYEVWVAKGVKVSDAPTARLCGGVALLIKKQFLPFVTRIYLEYDNCVLAKLSKSLTGLNSDCLFIGIYLPPQYSPYYSNTEIYNGVSVLESCILDAIQMYGNVPLIIVGDLNARTGNKNASEDELPCDITETDSEITGTFETYRRVSDDAVVNDFGQYLLCVCEQFNLIILNGIVDSKMDRSYTYIAHNGSSTIDYCILSRSIFDMALSLTVGQRIDSKHLPVEIELKSNMFKKKNVKCRKNIMQKYQWDSQKAHAYSNIFSSESMSLAIQDAYDLLDSDPEVALDKLYNIITLAAAPMLKTVIIGVANNNRWFDAECRKKRQSVRQALRKFKVSKRCGQISYKDLDNVRISYTETRKEYKFLLKQKQNDYKKMTLNMLESERNNPKRFWSTLKSYIGRPVNQCVISSQDWYDYFQTVFNEGISGANSDDTFLHNSLLEDVPVINIDCDTLEHEITHQEVLDAISALKNNKSAGPDGISGEFYKYAPPELALFLTKYFNKLFDSGLFPHQWSEAIIQPIHKKGDINSPNNYRGISLLNVCGKLYSYILNKRLTFWIEEHKLLNEAQAGFRRNYSTIDHIFTLMSLVQKQFLNHGKLYCAFIDFKKAFDLVERQQLWSVLRKTGVNGKMYKAIQSMYNIVKARIRVDGELTDTFMCPRGLKQGEICSPVLFSLFINELAQEITMKGKHGITLNPEHLQILILLFADDVLLLSNTIIGLQQQLNILSDTSKRLSLVVNMDKSKVVIFRKGGYVASRERWVYNGQTLEIVNQYKYLGIIFSTGLSFSYALRDMAARSKKGVIGILRLLWSLGNQSPQMFFKLFDCQIQPILTYGSEVWGLLADKSIIERVHLFAIKRFLNVSIRTPNALVYGESGRYPLYVNMYVKQINYWLTLTRMGDDRIPKKCYTMLYNIHCSNKNNWVSSICFTLYRYGFGFVWEQQGVGDTKKFISVFRQRLIDCYVQGWNSDINTKQRYAFYSLLKQDHGLSDYISLMQNAGLRKYLTRLRLGVSPLKCHSHRYYETTNICMDCPFCYDTYESEIHFMFTCPRYQFLREQYILPKFYRQPCLFRLVLLLSNPKHSVAVAMYINRALHIRASFLRK